MSIIVLLVMAIAVTGVAGFIDYRTGHIPNWLVLIGFAAGLVVNLVLPVVSTESVSDTLKAGAAQVVLGAVVCGLVPLLLWRFRAMGAGDVKLLAMLGVLLGPRLGAALSMYAFSIASLYVMVTLAYRGNLLRIVGSSLWALVNLTRPKAKRPGLPQELLRDLRFAPAIFVAVCVVALGYAA